MRIFASIVWGITCASGILAGAAARAAAQADPASAPEYRVEEVVEVGPAFSAAPVGFDLLTHGDHQFVAYYDADRWLTVAARRLGSSDWARIRLPEQFPWDSHNGVTMAVDGAGHLHLAANMHGDTLNYYRSSRPLDVTSLAQVNRMIGRDENRATYPQFLRDGQDRLVFYYRDGVSGNGRQIFNVYDHRAGEWRRLMEQPLLDGAARDMNAYPLRPVRGPDGAFHLVWMWRDTPDAATNHSLSYARSMDLVHWETASGKPLSLPITPDDTAAVVDPSPARKGLINMGFALGFDARRRPVVSYHRYDANGHSQIYNARLEDGRWKIHQTSDWASRWDFGGNGSIPSRVGAGPVRVLTDGRLVQDYHHWEHGARTWELDPLSLRPLRHAVLARRPADLERPRSAFPGMRVRWKSDSGGRAGDGRHYVLRWETLEQNRDRPREGQLPEPATLQLYGFGEP